MMLIEESFAAEGGVCLATALESVPVESF